MSGLCTSLWLGGPVGGPVLGRLEVLVAKWVTGRVPVSHSTSKGIEIFVMERRSGGM